MLSHDTTQSPTLSQVFPVFPFHISSRLSRNMTRLLVNSSLRAPHTPKAKGRPILTSPDGSSSDSNNASTIGSGSSVTNSQLSAESKLRLELEIVQLELEIEKSRNAWLRAELETAYKTQTKEHPDTTFRVDIRVETGGAKDTRNPRDAIKKLNHIIEVQKERMIDQTIQKKIEAEQRTEVVVRPERRAAAREAEAAKEAATKTERDLKRAERMSPEDELDAAEDIPEAKNDHARLRRHLNRSFHIWRSRESTCTTAFPELHMTSALRDHYVNIQQLLRDSTLVTFGAGLDVVSVLGGFDNGFIAIHGLPLDVRTDEIEALFFDSVTKFCIKDTRQHGDGTISVTAIVDGTQKQSLVQKLNGKAIRDRVINANVIDVARRPSTPHYTLSLTWDFLAPRSIRSTVSEFYLQEFYVCLRRELESSTGLSSYSFATPNPKGARNTATACFRTWASAKKVHDKLAGRRLKPHFPIIGCSLRPDEPRTKYALCVPLQLRNIHGLGSAVKHGLCNDVLEGDGMTTSVQFLSSGWFDGWTWSSDPKTVEFFEYDLIRRDLGISMIKRDWLTKTLTLYITTQGAVQLISNEIERFASCSDLIQYATPIQGRVTQLFHESAQFAELKEQLDKDAVWLDVDSSVCLLKFQGRPGPYSAIERFMEGLENSDGHKQSKRKCRMCRYEVNQYIKLPCGHNYCAGCLKLYILSAQSQNHYPLTCPGKDYRCQELITIPIIQSLLSPTEFQDLLEKAAELHIVRHRNQFKYCITASCTQIYRAHDVPSVLTCPSCLISFCSACRLKPHGKKRCGLLILDDKG